MAKKLVSNYFEKHKKETWSSFKKCFKNQNVIKKIQRSGKATAIFTIFV